MNDKLIEKIMKVLLGVSASAILTGALFKLEHYANGDLLLGIGFIVSFVFGSFEINRLRKTIKKMESQNPKS